MLEKLTQEETQKRFCGILKKKSDGVIEIKIHVWLRKSHTVHISN